MLQRNSRFIPHGTCVAISNKDQTTHADVLGRGMQIIRLLYLLSFTTGLEKSRRERNTWKYNVTLHFTFIMCLLFCACFCMCPGAHVCRGQRLASHVLLYCSPQIFFETGSFSETKNIQLGRLAGQRATESFFSPPLVLGLQTQVILPGFYMNEGTWTQSSSLTKTHFSQWAISPAPMGILFSKSKYYFLKSYLTALCL